MVRIWWVVMLLAALAPGDSRAEPPAPEGDAGYCAFVGGVAEGESAALMGPQIFTRFGLINAGEAAGAADLPLGAPTARLTAGLSYSFAGLYRGIALRRRAEAECRRFHAESALREATQTGLRLGAASALAARARVIAAELPRAGESLVELENAMSTGDATIEELDAFHLRLADLREQLRQTELERAQLGPKGALPAVPLRALWGELAAAQLAAEDLSADLRSSTTWDVTVQGGYDQLFQRSAGPPVFGMVTLSYDLGGLWQPAADARAREGLRQWLERGGPVADHGFGQLLEELEATQKSERARLADVALLVTDLEGQLAQVEALQTVQVRRFRDYLRMELARMRADQAYLEAHLISLGQMLPETP